MVPTHPWPLAIAEMNRLHQHLTAQRADPSGPARKALLKVLVTCIALGAFALPEKIELLL